MSSSFIQAILAGQPQVRAPRFSGGVAFSYWELKIIAIGLDTNSSH